MHVRGSEWSEDRIEKLKALHAKGLSCAMIADELGAGISRCAVIGKLHRLGMSNAGSTVRKANAKKNPRPKVEKAMRVVRASAKAGSYRLIEAARVEAEKIRCVDVVPLNVGLLDLEPHQCRYPIGNGQILFCGHSKIEGTSYCSPHYMLTHRSEAERRAGVKEAT